MMLVGIRILTAEEAEDIVLVWRRDTPKQKNVLAEQSAFLWPLAAGKYPNLTTVSMDFSD
jgi:hypothetical protein